MKFYKRVLKYFNLKASKSSCNNMTFQEKYNDLGAFKYYNDFFLFQYSNISKKIKWAEINQLIVYKRDLITIDRLEMDIIYGNYILTINEEIPGWYQFIQKTKEIFLTIPKNWDNDIVHPPFKTNMKVIYEKKKQ